MTLPEWNIMEEVRVCAECAIRLNIWNTIKEVVVIRPPGCTAGSAPQSNVCLPVGTTGSPVIQIWNVEEHGRRLYRSLIYCSDWRFSFRDMPAFHPETEPWNAPLRFSCLQVSPPLFISVAFHPFVFSFSCSLIAVFLSLFFHRVPLVLFSGSFSFLFSISFCITL